MDGVAATNLTGNRGAELPLCILLLAKCAALVAALLAARVVERTGMVSPGLHALLCFGCLALIAASPPIMIGLWRWEKQDKITELLIGVHLFYLTGGGHWRQNLLPRQSRTPVLAASS